jgi:tagaturonate reductase
MSNLPRLNRQNIELRQVYPERIVQFGAGNFLRGFVDWIVETLNEKTDFGNSIVVVKVTPHGTYEDLDIQDGLFHVLLQGVQNGEYMSTTKLITCISRTIYPYQDYAAYLALARQPEIRFLISNTTEAGIAYNENDQSRDKPPSSFPAKLTLFLYERYQYFQGVADKGCIIIPTELLENNGSQLRQMILRYAAQWELESDFSVWIEAYNIFCNTLVDRIVTGFPSEQIEQLQEELRFVDKLLVAGEPYHSWIIEAPDSLKQEFPVHKTALNVKIVADANPYRETKVRILNGLHTSMVPIGYLLGLESVRECMEHKALAKFLMDELYQEIIPSLDLPEDESRQFAEDVFDRFRNPSIHHRLLSIAVNSSTKVRTRILPSILAYQQKHQTIPKRLVLAMAAFIRFYKGEWKGDKIPLSDNVEVIDWFQEQWQISDSVESLVRSALENEMLWNSDLTQVDGLQKHLSDYLKHIDEMGILAIIEELNIIS